MRRAHYFILIIVFVVFTGTALFGSGIPVSIDDPVYGFLKRMETRGIVANFNDAALPLNRSEIADYICEIQKNDFLLNSLEKTLLREYSADYRHEISDNRQIDLEADRTVQAPFLMKGGVKKRFRDIFNRTDGAEEKHLLVYEEDKHFIWLDIEEGVKFEFKNGESRRLESDAFIFRGNLGGKLSFYLNAFRYRKTWNPAFTDTLKEQHGNWGMYQPDSLYTFDNAYSALVFHNEYYDLGIYRQPVLWGRSFSNNIILSDNPPVFTYLGFNSSWKNIKFSFIHGSLLNDSTSIKSAPDDVRNRQKYLAVHRVDFPLLSGKIQIGLTDIVVYGNRSLELSYLSPTNFFWTVGHNLIDRDNSLMAVDFKTLYFKNIELYGSLFLDELRLSELGKQWWANKQILQGGIRWSPILLSLPVDFQVEFTAVRPWVYTHKTLTTNYTNNALCLGFPEGPNSQQLFFRGETHFTRRTKLSCELKHLKHGVDENGDFWGGDVTSRYTLRDTTYENSTKWLMGPIQTTNSFDIRLTYEIFNDSFINTGIYYINKELNGKTTNATFFFVGLKINI